MKYLPTCPFPPSHWWAYQLSTNAQIDRDEIYIKQTFRNRFVISAVNRPVSLSIPVNSTKGIKTPISEIRISDHRWVNSYLTTIQSAYGRSAHFEHYFEDVSHILRKKHAYLIDLNLQTIEWTAKRLKIAAPSIAISATPNIGDGNDYRNMFEPSSIIPEMPSYPQVFMDRHSFQPGLSVIDVLFNMGPKAIDYLLLKNFR
ncbi:MAG: WbqC family protein [Flavobacteriales bacterium]|jgi:hypothetical protein